MWKHCSGLFIQIGKQTTITEKSQNCGWSVSTIHSSNHHHAVSSLTTAPGKVPTGHRLGAAVSLIQSKASCVYKQAGLVTDAREDVWNFLKW